MEFSESLKVVLLFVGKKIKTKLEQLHDHKKKKTNIEFKLTKAFDALAGSNEAPERENTYRGFMIAIRVKRALKIC